MIILPNRTKLECTANFDEQILDYHPVKWNVSLHKSSQQKVTITYTCVKNANMVAYNVTFSIATNI